MIFQLYGEPDNLIIHNGVECPKCKRTVSSFLQTGKADRVKCPMCKAEFVAPKDAEVKR